ncbi:MAG: Flp pilus assembly complex ATPase component TadA [Phycisphaeraceae bacterium]|nr:Flp pilus assembly complex ATPase component TadA [Phycisphaeraceae bacterium]
MNPPNTTPAPELRPSEGSPSFGPTRASGTAGSSIQPRPAPGAAAVTPLGQVLVDMGAITELQLQEALERQSQGGQRLMLGEILIGMGLVDPDTMLRAVAVSRGIDFVEDPAAAAEAGALALVPENLRRELRVLPLALDKGELVVATSEPQNFFIKEQLAKVTGFRVRFVASPIDQIDAALGNAPTDSPELVNDILDDVNEADFSIAESHASEAIGGETDADAGPVVKLVNFVICSAVKEGASDIHIEPDDGVLRVRFRVDGELYTKVKPPYRLHAAVASRVKIMAKLDISERRVPQDGEISVKIEGRPVDLRVSTLPGKFGEKVVMRVVDASGTRPSLEKLGFRPEMLARFQSLIELPHGIALVTGPTGSGKSTTLYAALSTFDTETLNVSTVEDPIESNLVGVHQAQTNPKAGFTFASALRALLRQDPDIVMVGEIRDKETGEIAVQAALTGHLVLSTLHTNDAPSAVTRLENLGIEPFLVAAALRGVLAQRLVRRICSQCRKEFEPDAAQRSALGRYATDATRLYRGTGCRKCRDTGLSGRLGLYELFIPDDEVLDLISARGEPAAMRKLLEQKGFETLWDDGMKKVLDGLTTSEEVHGACRD